MKCFVNLVYLATSLNPRPARGWADPLPRFKKIALKRRRAAPPNLTYPMGATFLHRSWNLRSGWRQVRSTGLKNTISGPNFNYLYAPVSLTISDRFLSNFQDVLKLPNCTTYRLVFYVAELRSSEVRDFLVLGLRESIQLTPIPKILEISASLYLSNTSADIFSDRSSFKKCVSVFVSQA